MRIQFPNTQDYTLEQSINKSNIGTGASASLQELSPAWIRQTGADGVPAKWGAKEGSFIDIREKAEYMDVDAMQDYMTVMSHTMSAEDFAKMEKDGFHFEELDPEEAVTIVDKIKAELVKSGKQIEGYTDDVSVEALAQVVGSEAMARDLMNAMATVDYTPSSEQFRQLGQAYSVYGQLQSPTEASMGYLLKNHMEPELWNFYLAQNSGASEGVSGEMAYFADESGYVSKSVQGVTDPLREQMDKVVEQAGLALTEETREDAKWLLQNGIALTEESLLSYEQLKEITFPMESTDFAGAVVNALLQGKNPLHANLTQTQTVYEKAVALLEKYKDVEEARLQMTAEVNVKLLKKDFAIDTKPMEEFLKNLDEAEKQIAKQYFGETSDAVDSYRIMEKTNRIVKELPGYPVSSLQLFAEKPAISLEEFAHGARLAEERQKAARDRYESIWTAPRADMGDSIKKAFGNVGEILEDLGYEKTEDNQRAVRILAYNRQEITVENLEQIKQADKAVSNVIEKMTPSSVLKMIRDKINPLEESFDSLNAYLDRQTSEEDGIKEYSRFLYGLEQQKEITEDERASFIGIYRLLHQIEKTDGAAIGSLVASGAQLDFKNLLSAVRTGKVHSLDIKVSKETGMLEDLLSKGESISNQIDSAFRKNIQTIMTEVSYNDETELQYARERVQELRTLTASSMQQGAELLENAKLPTTAENLQAAMNLVDAKDRELAKRLAKEDEAVQVWESLEEEDTFRENYRDMLEKGKEQLLAQVEDLDNYLDVRSMQLLQKQMTILEHIAPNEEYVFPMMLEDEPAQVHLTIRHDKEEKGKIYISFQLSEEEQVEANLSLSGGKITGLLSTNGEGKVMKLQKCADILYDFVKEDNSWSMDAKLTVMDSVTRIEGGNKKTVGNGMFAKDMAASLVEDHSTEEMPTSGELYRLTKVFLRAMKQAM